MPQNERGYSMIRMVFWMALTIFMFGALAGCRTSATSLDPSDAGGTGDGDSEGDAILSYIPSVI